MAGRERAEAEQRQLKASVAYKAELIENMSSLLQRRLLDEAHGKTNNVAMSRERDSRVQSNDTALFESLLSELDALYEKADEVISACGPSIKPWASMSYQPTRKWHNGTEYFENVDSTLVPFDFQRTCRAVWQAFIATEGPDAYYYEGVKDPENMVAVRMCCQYQWEAFGVASMTSHFVTRKYKEADRLVFVWRALSEGEDAFVGMYLDDSGWGVVSPVAKGAGDPMTAGSSVSVVDGDASDSTIIQHVVRSVPVFFGEKSSSDTKMDQYVNLVVRSGVEDVEEIVRSMRKLLLDDTVVSVSS
ncbi:hypothetical protein BBJ28_00019014 [Nothophytophthora sp. Chile5]|nr:hypothetical protein BBJ28_00019014 [Nothophytophthora sp. Chile5]